MKKLRRDKIFSQYLKTENYSKTMQLVVLDFSAEQNHALIQFSLFGSLYPKSSIMEVSCISKIFEIIPFFSKFPKSKLVQKM